MFCNVSLTHAMCLGLVLLNHFMILISVCTFPLRAPVLTFSHEIIDNREGVKQKKVKAEGKKKSFTGK